MATVAQVTSPLTLDLTRPALRPSDQTALTGFPVQGFDVFVLLGRLVLVI